MPEWTAKALITAHIFGKLKTPQREMKVTKGFVLRKNFISGIKIALKE